MIGENKKELNTIGSFYITKKQYNIAYIICESYNVKRDKKGNKRGDQNAIINIKCKRKYGDICMNINIMISAI